MVSVKWSEAIVRCAGTVSQYMLSVIPPTSDCQSSPDCMVMDGSSVITRPGTETQYSLTVSCQDYNITARTDTCCGSLTGDISSVCTVNLAGETAVVKLQLIYKCDRCFISFRKCDILQCSLYVQSIEWIIKSH